MKNTQERTTEAKKEKFIKAFIDNSFNISKACENAGIYRRTYYDWIAKDKDFESRVEEAQEKLIDEVEEALRQKILIGDTTSIIFFLKTKGKKRGYIEKQETELSMSNGPLFQINLKRD